MRTGRDLHPWWRVLRGGLLTVRRANSTTAAAAPAESSRPQDAAANQAVWPLHDVLRHGQHLQVRTPLYVPVAFVAVSDDAIAEAWCALLLESDPALTFRELRGSNRFTTSMGVLQVYQRPE